MPAFVVGAPHRACDNRGMNLPTARAVLSPCVGVCEIDADGLCGGCLRTLDEIARWSTMGDADRMHVMDELLPRREAMRDAGA